MKLCKDCKHFHKVYRGVFLPETPGCNVEQMVDLIDGDKIYRDCRIQRAEHGKCGPDAKLFELDSPTP